MQFDETVTTPIQRLQRTPTEAIAQQPSVNEFRPKILTRHHSLPESERSCLSSYHRRLAARWISREIRGFDLVLYCHLLYERCPSCLAIPQTDRLSIENQLLETFLSHFRSFSQQWRLLRAYAFGRFWQVKTAGVEYLQSVRLVIEKNPLYSQELSQVCSMIQKTVEWNSNNIKTEPPWCDCQLYDAHSLSESFEYHKTPVSIIKYVYHAYILKIKIEQLNLDLLRALFEQLTSTFTIRDIWLVLGYHLAGCFWGDQDGCVEYLEYFTQCLGVINLEEDPTWGVHHRQLLDLIHGLAYQNRNAITKSLREGFVQSFEIMDNKIIQLCQWQTTTNGQELLNLRNKCRKDLKEVIVPIFQEYSLVEYGSTRLQLDMESSDLDIVLVPYKITSDDVIESFEVIEECRRANVQPVERVTVLTMIDALRRKLKELPQFSEVNVYPSARVPLLRCKYFSQITVDISAHSNVHLFNNIYTIYSIINGRNDLKRFLIAIKTWAKKFDLVQPFHGTMNSHGWTMMTIFTWKLLSNSARMVGVTAGECFVKFFRLFRDFKRDVKAISIKDCMFVTKSDHNVVLEFEGLYGGENVCRHVTFNGAELIFGAIGFTDQYLLNFPLKEGSFEIFQEWLDNLKREFDVFQVMSRKNVQSDFIN